MLTWPLPRQSATTVGSASRAKPQNSWPRASPEIAAAVKLKDLAGEAVLPAESPTRIVLDESLAESAAETRLTEVLQSSSPATEVVLAIGPEGGWTDSAHLVPR